MVETEAANNKVQVVAHVMEDGVFNSWWRRWCSCSI